MASPSKSKTGQPSDASWDPAAITEAVQQLNNLKDLITNEAFPGMRAKDTITIRKHLETQIAVLSAEIAKAVAANQGKPFLSQDQADRIRREAQQAVQNDLTSSVLDRFFVDEEN